MEALLSPYLGPPAICCLVVGGEEGIKVYIYISLCVCVWKTCFAKV